jgi:hypothetical protein
VQPGKGGAARWGLAWSWRKGVLALAGLLLVLDEIVAVSVRYRWAGLPSLGHAAFHQVPDGEGYLHRTLRQLLHGMRQAKERRERREGTLEEASGHGLPFTLPAPALTPPGTARRSFPWPGTARWRWPIRLAPAPA